MGQGRGWQPGQVRARLAALIERYRDVPKQPATAYTGGDIGTPRPSPAAYGFRMLSVCSCAHISDLDAIRA